MQPLDLQSEFYQPTGSISADGIKNQLGRPKFDRLTLLAREAVQNSWDARRTDADCVVFGMAGWQLEKSQLRWLLDVGFRRAPSGGLDTRQLLESSPSSVLAIYDRGTKGLAGPTRADAVGPNDDANFVNLLRNVGQPPTTFRGGGTYGFGKTALFLASHARTIVIHTQVAAGRGKVEQRLMGAALGTQYTHRGLGSQKRFTGRHWWGRKGRGNVVDPLVGREAAEAARSLGVPKFEKEETGTTILILLPEFEPLAPDEALRHLSSAILRNFWPKMIDGARGAATMKFELSWNGQAIPMPRPHDVPPLNGFVKAFANLQAHLAGRKVPHQPASFHEIKSLKPQKNLGVLSLVRFAPSPRLEIPPGDEEVRGPFAGPSRHTALMRSPHFVVDYLEGPPVPYEQAEYAGVFMASEEAEESFARSEPPTHDDWSPDMLDNRADKTFVRVGMRRIAEAMEEFTGASAIPRAGGDGVPLGAFSDYLGGLIPAEQGMGARPNGGVQDLISAQFGDGAISKALGGSTSDSGGAGGGSPTSLNNRQARGSRVRILESSEPEVVSGLTVFTVRFDLGTERRARQVSVTAVPMVVLEEGSVETDAPSGAQRPRVLQWADFRGSTISKSDKIEIRSGDQGPWLVTVVIPSDAAVALELTAQETR